MSRPLKDDIDELVYRITVTEYFTGEGYEEMTEKKMELRTPIRNCLGALYGYAIDYCKFHNMRSDNHFVIRVYSASNDNRAKKIFEKVVTGTLSEGDYNNVMHKDYLASNGFISESDFNMPIVVKPTAKPKPKPKKDIKDRRPVKLNKYDEYAIKEDVSRGATISDIMTNYNLGYEQSKELVSKYRGKEDLDEYDELMKEMGK